MTMLAEPDVVQAFIDQTLSLPNTTSLTVRRVSGRLRTKSQNDPRGWQMPTFAIVFRAVAGPSVQEPGTVPMVREPLQGEFYGPTLRESRRLWRIWLAEMAPNPIQQIQFGQVPKPRGFVMAGVAVYDFETLGAAAPIQEDQTDFPRTVVTLMVRYCTLPVLV